MIGGIKHHFYQDENVFKVQTVLEKEKQRSFKIKLEGVV